MDYRCIAIICCVTASLGASLPDEATPWTKSFLETKAGAAVERYSLATHGRRYARTPHTQYDGVLFASSAPVADWEFDTALFGRSWPTGKFFVRAERQILSDLERDPVALTAVVDGFLCGHERSYRPVFFEMAKDGCEVGLGIGRHAFIQKSMYTQVFSYVFGGMGTSRARWARAEVGVQQVFSRRHTIRLSYEWLKTFGHSESFHGMGTLRALCHDVAFSYGYRFDNGFQVRCSYAKRLIHRWGLRSSSQVRVSLAIPVSFA